MLTHFRFQSNQSPFLPLQGLQITLRNASTTAECRHSQTNVSPSHPATVISPRVFVLLRNYYSRCKTRVYSPDVPRLCVARIRIYVSKRVMDVVLTIFHLSSAKEILTFSMINKIPRARYCCHCLSNLLFFRSRAPSYVP